MNRMSFNLRTIQGWRNLKSCFMFALFKHVFRGPNDVVWRLKSIKRTRNSMVSFLKYDLRYAAKDTIRG